LPKVDCAHYAWKGIKTLRSQPSVRLKISEIFYSIQGESDTVGWPTVFVRLSGCPLRCQYCDTAYAFHGGKTMSVRSVAAAVSQYQCRNVTVTGGEPLAQPACWTLLSKLCDQGYRVALETGGSLDIGCVDSRVSRVLDIKTPGSGEAVQNRWGNLDRVGNQDAIKFVLCSRADYEWARETVAAHELSGRCTVFFSPSANELSPQSLAEWILQDHLAVRMQLQMHKVLWGNAKGR